MSGPQGAPDRVDAAIANVEGPPRLQLQQWQVTIDSTGRPALLALPTDVTDVEIAELAGWMLTTLTRTLQVQRQKAKSGLVIARGHVARA